MKLHKPKIKLSVLVMASSVALCFIHPGFASVLMSLGAMAMHATMTLLAPQETKNSELETLKVKIEQTSSEVKKISLLLLGRK